MLDRIQSKIGRDAAIKLSVRDKSVFWSSSSVRSLYFLVVHQSIFIRRDRVKTVRRCITARQTRVNPAEMMDYLQTMTGRPQEITSRRLEKSRLQICCREVFQHQTYCRAGTRRCTTTSPPPSAPFPPPSKVRGEASPRGWLTLWRHLASGWAPLAAHHHHHT